MILLPFQLSPIWFKFMKKVLDTTYFNSSNRDSRMAFFGLDPLYQTGFPEFRIQGEWRTRDYCTVRGWLLEPALLADSTHLKTMQKTVGFFKQFGVATWGAVVMPAVWRGFIDWVFEKLQNGTFRPTTPTTHWSNNWGEAWSPWFFRLIPNQSTLIPNPIWNSRYEWERGLYTLRYCFPDRTGVLKNHREVGVHTSFKVNDYGSKLGGEEKNFERFPKERARDFPCWNFHLDPNLKKVGDSFCTWEPWQVWVYS